VNADSPGVIFAEINLESAFTETVRDAAVLPCTCKAEGGLP